MRSCHHWLVVLVFAAGLAAFAAPLEAQVATFPREWSRATELAVVAGAASNETASGPAVAAVIGWELTRWTAVEGRGSWYLRGKDAHGFGADLGLIVNVLSRRPITPYVGAGFGLYHASFDSPASPMSAFYRQRVPAPTPGGAVERSFTDPALRVTAGVDFLVGRRLSIRPEVSTLVVRRHGDGEGLAVFGLRMGYRFEEHPVTPGR
jgi:hypothetical protein